MINQRNTTISVVLFSLLFIGNIHFSFGQDCSYLSKANDIVPLGKCAPVDVAWEIIYRGVNDKGTALIQIQYDWDDGNPVEVVNATLTNGATHEWTATHSHIYPNTGNQCNYHPRATLMVDGVICTSSVQEQIVTVWDTDDKNGGYLSISPDPKPICVGNDALFHFTDESQWNCTPPDENDIINKEDRWIQWIYGTGATTINDAKVDGSVRAYPWKDVVNHVPGDVEGPIAPFNTSLDIYIPDHHPVGAFFEVTLRNWNTCNPYDDPNIAGPPVDLIDGDYDPVTITARAIIVALPDASINAVPEICESEDPFLLIAADGGGQWSGPGISAPGSALFDPKLAGAGIHTITYSITDGNSCSDIGSVIITVKGAPKADISIFKTIDLCPGTLLELDGTPTGGTTPYTHQWKGQTSPLSSTIIHNPDFMTTTIGQYELIYRVTDKNSCWNEDTVIVDVEDVNISFSNNDIETCLGSVIKLDAQPTGGSESFTSHQWTGTHTDKLSATDIQAPDFNANEAGVFQFNYTVKDSHNCEDTETITITVHAQPSSNAGTDITECDLQSTLAAIPSTGNGTWKIINGPGSLTFESFSTPDPKIVADTYGLYELRWVENNHECKDSADLNVTFIEMPAPTVMADKDTCGLSLQLIANKHIGAGKWLKAEGSGSATFTNDANEITQVTVDDPGKYKFVWLEDNSNGCIGSDTVEVNFFSIPTAQITPPITVGCTPLEISFQNTSSNADTYYWDFGNGIISNLEDPHQIFTNKTPDAVDYEISMIARSLNGCSDTIKHSVKVAPTPISHFDADLKIDCHPLNSNFTNNSQGGTSYEWTFGDGSAMENSVDAHHTFTNTEAYVQSYKVQLVTINTYNCSDTSNLFTTVYPKHEFKLSASPDSACAPLNSTFMADPGAYKYDWDFGDGNLIAGANLNSKLFNNDTNTKEKHEITVYTTSFYGCLDTTSTTVTVLPSPTANFEPNDFAICSPKEVLFTNSSTNATNSYWDFGDGNNANTLGTENIDHTYVNNNFTPLNYKIRLVVENSFGCKDSMDGFTSVNPALTAAINGATTDCSPFEASFENNSVGANSYVWDYGDGNTSGGVLGQNIFENTSNDEVIYEVTMIASSPYGCKDTASVEVKALPSPSTYFEPNDFTVCSPKKVEFTNYTENIISSVWKFGDGTEATTISNESIEHIYTNDKFTPQDFKINLITENSFGCKDSMIGFTSVNPNVEAKITGTKEDCAPLEVSFGNESAGANDFVWNYGDGNTSTGYLGLNMFKNNTEEDIDYEISMIATSAYGCSDTAYTKVTVYATPKADFSITPEEQQMPESTIEINNLTSGSKWDYIWDFGDENTSSDKEPDTHTYGDFGTYSVSLKVFSDKCESILKKEIRIIAGIPTVEYGPNSKGCPALKVDFYSTTLNAESYVWDFGDGNGSSDPNPTHTYYTEGTYSVKLTVSGPGGQTIKDDLVIEVYPEPTALFDVFPNVVTIPGESVTFANKSLNGDDYLWNFGDGQSSNEMNPVHDYTSAGDYDITLDVENEFGCINTYIQHNAVTAQEGGEIKLPNAFTPNISGAGDGRYDRTDTNNYIFHPGTQKGIVEYKLQIFSRWGQLLFQSEDIAVGWNGYYKNKLCSQGVYIWKVTCRFSTGQVKVLTGDVTLLR